MLENFTPTTSSDNRPLARQADIEGIVRGATCIHMFKLPIDTEEDIKEYKVSYKQGLHTILEKSANDCELEASDLGIFARVLVSPEESRLFNAYNKYTFVQIAIMLLDDTITYSDMYRLKVADSINDAAFEEIE